LEEIAYAVDDVDVSLSAEGYADLAHVLDLRGALVVAEVTMVAARERRETRGAHNRADYPNQDPERDVNLAAALRDGRPELTAAPVPPVPDRLQAWASAAGEPSVSGRLLE
jgi:succinate dehydrogenase / fumarate reductase flavoprotein subunit